MEKLKKRYKLKGDSYGKPNGYLGVNEVFTSNRDFFVYVHRWLHVRESYKIVKQWRIDDKTQKNKEPKKTQWGQTTILKLTYQKSLMTT